MKKFLSLVLALSVLFGVCAILPAQAAEVVELNIATNSLNNGFPTNIEDDWVHQKILEDTGISVVITLIDDYYTSLNARITGGNIPDVFIADAQNMRTYAKEDIILDLTPYKEDGLANLMAWLGDTDTTAYTYQGQLYALPKRYTNSKSYINLNVRQDWLDNLGLSIPTTIQELYDVAYAFTFKDPDQNGIDDTFGLSSQKGYYGFDSIALSFDAALGNYVIIRDGKVTNALLQPGMKDALTWCKKFVDDGLMDPDCYTTSGTNKAIAGQVGLITLAWSSLFKQAYQDQVAEVNPNANWVAFGPLKSEVGCDGYMAVLDPCVSAGAYCVSADISDEKLDAVFRLMDYLTSTEGSNLVYYGLEGVHWNYDENGNIKMTDLAKDANFTPTYQLISRSETEYLPVKFPEATAEFTLAMEANRYYFYNSLIEEPETVYLSDLEDYAKNQLLAFIYGDRPIEEYDAFVQELYDIYGFGEYMDAAAEQMAAYGYVE